MIYTLQIDGTAPDKWRDIKADSASDAIVEAIRPLLKQGLNPSLAYVAETTHRHPNGTPICVQSYSLTVNRNEVAQ